MSDSKRVNIRLTKEEHEDAVANARRLGFSTDSELVYHVIEHREVVTSQDDFGYPDRSKGGPFSDTLSASLAPGKYETLADEADAHGFPTLTHYLRALIRRREQILDQHPEEMQALQERVDELEQTVSRLRAFVEDEHGVDLGELDLED